MNNNLITVHEAAVILALSPRSVRRLVQQRHLASMRYGPRFTLLDAADVVAFKALRPRYQRLKKIPK